MHTFCKLSVKTIKCIKPILIVTLKTIHNTEPYITSAKLYTLTGCFTKQSYILFLSYENYMLNINYNCEILVLNRAANDE